MSHVFECYHARQSLLFDDDNVWVKKIMGSYDDGAELCELVG